MGKTIAIVVGIAAVVAFAYYWLKIRKRSPRAAIISTPQGPQVVKASKRKGWRARLKSAAGTGLMAAADSATGGGASKTLALVRSS